jgi:predicted DNA-binding protein (MmcQ/YjbR family)
MDIESLRAYCLSLPQATEGIQWGNDLLFRIGGKMFAVTSLETSPTRLSFKCTPEKFDELIEQEGIVPAPYMARNKWVMLERLEALNDAEIKKLVRNSYDMILAKLP